MPVVSEKRKYHSADLSASVKFLIVRLVPDFLNMSVTCWLPGEPETKRLFDRNVVKKDLILKKKRMY